MFGSLGHGLYRITMDYPSLSRLWHFASAANAPQRCCSAPPGLGMNRILHEQPSKLQLIQDQIADLSDVIYIISLSKNGG